MSTRQPFAKTRVYGGLSISEEQTHSILPYAEFSGPVQRGDLPRDLSLGFQCIVIVDGVFQQALSVSPGEVLDAIRYGVRVYGASSMGAMRAAELETLGMIGVGRVFSEIKKRSYFRDDYLGQAFSPDAAKALSLSFIDIEVGSEELVRRGKITPKQRVQILKIYEGLHFSERNPATLVKKMAVAKDSALASMAVNMPRLIQSVKKRDAIEVLNRVRGDLDAIDKWTLKYQSSVVAN